jgi:hypothetical protein
MWVAEGTVLITLVAFKTKLNEMNSTHLENQSLVYVLGAGSTMFDIFVSKKFVVTRRPL